MLVLQVEYEYDNVFTVGPGMEIERTKNWRDATVEDLTVLQDLPLTTPGVSVNV